MTASGPTPEQLREMVGRRVRYRGRVLTVVEVLADGPALVLQEAAGGRFIQANQYGEARRRAPETLTIPVYAPGGLDLHPVFRELEPI